MNVILSEYAGFCFGVQRSADLLDQLLSVPDHPPVYCVGELIHNRDYIDELQARGVSFVTDETLDRIPDGAIAVLRTHGVPFKTLETLTKRALTIEDATCPFVKRTHRIAEDELARGADLFLIVGDRDHPEVKALLSRIPDEKVRVIGTLSDLISIDLTAFRRCILLSQTTANHDFFKDCAAYVEEHKPDAVVYDTVCKATEQRQIDAVELAKRCDVMLVIGGKNSSNSRKLAELAQKHCTTCFIERASEIPKDLLQNARRVGITAGASTPRRIIEEVVCYMTENNRTEETLSFEELLEQSFKTLSPGDVATGNITRILPAEMHVDLGIKHTGILPLAEVSDDPSFKLEENFKVGDEVTVLVQKFNDAEGTVQVSKKKLDNRAGWQKIVNAYQADEILTGTVSSAIKGGILVSWEGQSIFVPGSLSGLPKEADLRTMVGTQVEFKLAELDEQKRRTVGSIRAVERERRKALSEQFWNEVEPGKIYTGKVKSITSYGAFVDLGGADGMIHITELSWKRLSHPSEVVSIGQEVTVYVKDVNYDAHKISLGYKTDADNPWNKFVEQFHEGDVTKVTIVNMTTFGAFAEIIPGVDGLIHISQITNKHITKPQDVLTIGEVVDVEIIGINTETKKISLSMRSLLPPEEQTPAAEEIASEEKEEVPEAPAEEAPANETPADEAPAEEKPAEEAPAEEKPKAKRTKKKAEEAEGDSPAEEAPAEEPAPKKTTRKKKTEEPKEEEESAE